MSFDVIIKKKLEMKSILFGLLLSAALLYSQAQEDAKAKDGQIKIYKRLIPADVLRGESDSSEGSGESLQLCYK